LKIIRTIAELRIALAHVRSHSIGFVPTMGAFHEGHLELMRQARKENRVVVASLFVNPTQFSPHEDLSRYPRQEEQDCALAESVGVDIMFAPSVDEMYPGSTTEVVVNEVSTLWGGQQRPTHFAGVATIVCKLFNIVQPDIAYFGYKDLQQCAVISRMVRDLNIPVKLTFVETVRESDGLAMSSRNAYLSPEERALAPEFNRILTQCAEEIRTKARSPKDALLMAHQRLSDSGFKVDYLAIVDPVTMQESQGLIDTDRLMSAIRLGKVRLLDNIPINII